LAPLRQSPANVTRRQAVEGERREQHEQGRDADHGENRRAREAVVDHDEIADGSGGRIRAEHQHNRADRYDQHERHEDLGAGEAESAMQLRRADRARFMHVRNLKGHKGTKQLLLKMRRARLSASRCVRLMTQCGKPMAKKRQSGSKSKQG
jgi:hypothetical protein